MGLFKKPLQPLSDGDKTIIVYSYLDKLKALPDDIKSWSDQEVLNLMLGTPQYTLVNCLELYYLYKNDDKFAKHIRSLAESYDIHLQNFKGTPRFLISLGYTFILTRPNLDPSDRGKLIDSWTAYYRNPEKPFASEDEERDSWVNNIVAKLQEYEAKQATTGDVLGNVSSYEEYLEQIELAIEHNDDLVKWYQDYRGLK